MKTIMDSFHTDVDSFYFSLLCPRGRALDKNSRVLVSRLLVEEALVRSLPTTHAPRTSLAHDQEPPTSSSSTRITSSCFLANIYIHRHRHRKRNIFCQHQCGILSSPTHQPNTITSGDLLVRRQQRPRSSGGRSSSKGLSNSLKNAWPGLPIGPANAGLGSYTRVRASM